jgi:hypothetical protein
MNLHVTISSVASHFVIPLLSLPLGIPSIISTLLSVRPWMWDITGPVLRQIARAFILLSNTWRRSGDTSNSTDWNLKWYYLTFYQSTVADMVHLSVFCWLSWPTLISQFLSLSLISHWSTLSLCWKSWIGCTHSETVTWCWPVADLLWDVAVRLMTAGCRLFV